MVYMRSHLLGARMNIRDSGWEFSTNTKERFPSKSFDWPFSKCSMGFSKTRTAYRHTGIVLHSPYYNYNPTTFAKTCSKPIPHFMQWMKNHSEFPQTRKEKEYIWIAKLTTRSRGNTVAWQTVILIKWKEELKLCDSTPFIQARLPQSPPVFQLTRGHAGRWRRSDVWWNDASWLGGIGGRGAVKGEEPCARISLFSGQQKTAHIRLALCQP